MPYSNAWNEAQPLGSAAANTIDDIIRQLKVDIRERMNDILDSSTQWQNAQIGLKGTVGRVLMLGPQEFVPITTAIGTHEWGIGSGGYVQSTGGGLLATIPARADWRIKAVEMIVDRNASAQVTCTFDKHTFSTTPASTNLGTLVVTAAGPQLALVYNSSYSVTIADIVTIRVYTPVSGTAFRVYGARITYDEF